VIPKSAQGRRLYSARSVGYVGSSDQLLGGVAISVGRLASAELVRHSDAPLQLILMCSPSRKIGHQIECQRADISDLALGQSAWRPKHVSP